MSFLASCMSYPSPYGPSEIESKPPRYRKPHMQRSEKTCSYKSVASDLPPAYTEKAAETEAASSGRTFKPSSLLRAWVLEQRKPYSAVTVQIDRLTGDQYEEDDLGGIIDLVEVIRIQGSGPTEAARAIRKKLKYGNAHRQIRALVILDGLMQNAGSRFQRAVADEPLLERLRILARDDMVDSEVRKRCNSLFRQWANAYKNTPGLEKIATLYKQLPTTTRPAPQQLKVLQETDMETHSESNPFASSAPAVSSSSRPVTLTAAPKLSSSSVFKSSSKDKKDNKKDKPKRFNLENEKPQILETIAGASVASTNLSNALQLVNRENERVSENKEVMSRFETCKILRRKILGYIQLVESEQWIGSLLTANDELVKALTAFEILDKSIDDDSDSAGDWDDDDDAKPSGTSTSTGQKGAAEALAGLNIGGGEAPPAKPPRPGTTAMPPPPHLSSTGKKPLRDSDSDSEEEDVDDDNPFGDENAVSTPRNERAGMSWK
ncbi:hypothetical protein B0A49_02503 [Cryomyces minteri]|uniref:VHS domain-containing protein n=1 Tax=Cryomyces minteri TaxID=331657 RepID=A0A4U0XWT4_9PEZI|nr:hypothetical protein B0A49_02503 [Cryomyces minteri]